MTASDETEELQDPAALADWLAHHAVTTIECCFVDLWGVVGSRRLTVRQFLAVAESGLSMPRAPYLWSSAADIVELPVANAANGFPNLRAFPDLASLRPATWLAGGAVCFLEAAPLPENGLLLDSRAILRAVHTDMEGDGLAARVASEVEFYLLRADGSAVHDGHRPFSLEDVDELEPILGEVRDHLLNAGVLVESIQTEYGPGQIEINISPNDPLRNADDAALLRAIVKITAARHGLRATFMPMPVQGGSGSGHHLHVSMLDAESRAATVFEVTDEGKLNAPLGSFVAGILEWAPALTSIYLPSINAYKRTADYTFAPNRLCWATDNRTASIRIPEDRGVNTRIEMRIPSADCNAHLVSAALLASGHEGIRRTLSPPPPLVDDAYSHSDLPRLPAGLAEALAILEARRAALEQVLPIAGVVDAILLHGRQDLAAFANHVTDWESARYLTS